MLPKATRGLLTNTDIRAGLKQEQGLVRPQRGKEGHPGKEEGPGPRLCASIQEDLQGVFGTWEWFSHAGGTHGLRKACSALEGAET